MKDNLIKPHRKNTQTSSQDSYEKVVLKLADGRRLNTTA